MEVIPTPDTSSPNPVANVRVVESGFVSTQVSLKAANPANMAEFQREDFVITPLTEEEAKSKALQTGESGEDGSTFCVYKWVTLLYRCKTADGTEKDLSELIVWPYALIGEATPSQLVIGCHSTITSDAQRPTNFSNLSSLGEINMLALFTSALSQKALVIVPDYEGYGSTASYPHPYCNRELTAEQVVTGVKAGLSWFESEVSSMDEDWSAVSIGDEVVPYCNFESVRSSWGIDNIKAVTYQSGSLHVATGTDFFLKYCGSLVNEILKDTWTPCEKVID